MIVERATLADARAVAEIQVDAWRAAYANIIATRYLALMSVDQREAVWRETIEAGNPLLLVAREFEGGPVLGWISFGICRDKGAPSSWAEVWALYVAPTAWFRGVGRSLWTRARQLLRECGFSICSLWVLEQNTQAIHFYRSNGFIADDVPPQTFPLGGQPLREVRYRHALYG